MSKYYKFVNEHKVEEFKNQYVVVDGRIYAGVISPEILKRAGYKELVTAELPEYNSETHYLDKRYADGEVITEVYDVVEIPVEEIEYIEEPIE